MVNIPYNLQGILHLYNILSSKNLGSSIAEINISNTETTLDWLDYL